MLVWLLIEDILYAQYPLQTRQKLLFNRHFKVGKVLLNAVSSFSYLFFDGINFQEIPQNWAILNKPSN